MTDWGWVKDDAVPVILAAITFAGGWYARVAQSSSENANRRVLREQAQLQADTAEAANLTERFRALMDGYEHRIDDLSRDARDVRLRNSQLEHEVRTRKAICNDCDNFQTYMKDHPNAFPAAS